jgi:phage-related protein
MKNLALPFIAKKNESWTTDPWIRLLYVPIQYDGTDLVYVAITNDNKEVTFGGVTYVPWPFIMGPIPESVDGSLPETDLTVSNVSLDVNRLLNDDLLIGKPITVREVNRALLDDPACCDAMVFVIKNATETNEAVTFKLGIGNLFEQPAPKRTYARTTCNRVFGTNNDFTTGCGWDGITGSATCNHTLEDCQRHNNTVNHGAFWGIPRTLA